MKITEREACMRRDFEAAVNERFNTNPDKSELSHDNMLARNSKGEYIDACRENEWWAWQAALKNAPISLISKRSTVIACAKVLAQQHATAFGCTLEQSWEINGKKFLAQAKAIIRKVSRAQKKSE